MKEVIEGFYQAFHDKDSEKMISFYHEEIIFSDPAFGTLQGERAKNMWKMLLEAGKDLKVNYSNVSFDQNIGKANWEAHYTFSKTNRKIHNKITAHFKFKEGKIIEHIDDFNLRKWAQQALGLKGAILGGTKFFRSKLQNQTNRMLDKFEEKIKNQ